MKIEPIIIDIKVVGDPTKPVGWFRAEYRNRFIYRICYGTNPDMKYHSCDDCSKYIDEETEYRNNGLCDECKEEHPFD